MAKNGKKSRKKLIIFSVIGLFVVALGVVLFLGSRKEPVITVQVEKVQARTITQVVTATGKIQPEVLVKITPEVSGEIVSLPVKEGQKVKKGDILMKIKPDIYIAQRDQWAAGLLQAKASLSKSEPEFRRMQALFKKGLVSESEYDIARASFEANKAAYAQATASLNQANESLRKTTVLAPMNGTVSQLNSELGERVLGTVQFQGTDVMTIADLSRMESRVDVSENDVVLLSIGDTARIEVDAFPDRKVTAVVYEIANTATSKGLGTQEEVTNFQVKMRIVNADLQLRPGMSMTAGIETETRHNVLTVPIQSVTTRMPKAEVKPGEGDGQSGAVMTASTTVKKKEENKAKEIVFVVDGGVVKAMPVKRGISDDAYMEITEGVKDSMQVVSGTYKAINRELEDGAKVRVEEQKKQSVKKTGEGA
jgi:HlyD family secretion protein